ncbi:ABC transporter transmembrane domain-containing protein [Coleofasciculus sp.]|uniref:ABC transporter transmembrane domain-containing protein n=1 Tax=Coleofasciculus sp. TaxID=3100458 RepID=UPI0039FA8746
MHSPVGYVGQKLRIKNQLVWQLGRALHLVWQSGPGWTIASATLIVVQGMLPLLSLYLMKLVIDAVTIGSQATDKTVAFFQVAFLISLSGAVALGSTLCRSIARLVNETQTQVVTDYIYDILHAKSIEVDLDYYENSQYYDTLHRAQEQAFFRPTYIISGLVQVAQSAISLLAIAALLLKLHWGIVIILLVTALPRVGVRLKYAEKMYRWQRQRTLAERQAKYFNWILTGDTHAKEIRLFDLGSLFRQRFHNVRQQLRRERLAIATRRSISELATHSSATLALFCSFAFIAYQTVQGKLTLGELVMYYQAFLRDSQLIVLDEPTSAMDPLAEYEVFQKFRQLLKNQAAILISHRLSTAKMADCIYVLENGRIVESGTHEALIQLNGIYAHLFETQAQNYR